MSYFFVDVEADGPCPGLYSMVSFGAVKFDDDLETTFYRETFPITNNYKLEALQISCPDRETHEGYGDPHKAMIDFEQWILNNNTGSRPIFMSDNPPALDQFDCIIVDEAHRGYTLDQEMTEGEIATRDTSQYLSSYRRVLDYFDAVRVGLTATPAKHTSEIFGKPVYTYSYREAVAEDWLIDHEPPIRYETLLTQQGITFEKGEEVSSVNTETGEIETAELDDELKFDVTAFNRRVITEPFNKVICDQLAKELDPFSDEKTMIFCVTDLHADMVKSLLDEAFKAMYKQERPELWLPSNTRLRAWVRVKVRPTYLLILTYLLASTSGCLSLLSL